MSLDLRNRDLSRSDRIVTTGIWARLRQLLIATTATLAARRMLARITRRYRARGSPHIPPHLLRDLGLPEDYFVRRPDHWDHQ